MHTHLGQTGTCIFSNFSLPIESTPQDSTGEAPFFLLYGRDARLPTETAISQPLTPYQENLHDYRVGLVAGLSEAWDNARQNIGKAQRRQKAQDDKKAPHTNTHTSTYSFPFPFPHTTNILSALVSSSTAGLKGLTLLPRACEDRMAVPPEVEAT